MIRTAVWSLTTLVLAACVTNPYYDPAKPHHTRDGFRNRYPHAEKGSFWKWKMEQWREAKPEEMPAGGWGFTVLRPDVGFLKSNRSTDTLTWIGHSSFLLQLDGVNILTDPHLTKRASPVWGAYQNNGPYFTPDSAEFRPPRRGEVKHSLLAVANADLRYEHAKKRGPLTALLLAHNRFGDSFLEASCRLGGKPTGRCL